jgi:4-amino-4-deoxy-L-arabinose transferase-like glycosyltransferase
MPGGASRRALLALVAFGLVARLFLLLAFPRVIRWDEPDYIRLATNLVSGAGYAVVPGIPDLHYPPLFPLLLAPLHLLVSDPEWPSNVWYLLCGALLPWPVWSLARRVYGERVAVWAAILTAAFPLLTIGPLHWGTFTEPPFLLLLFAGLDRAHAAWTAVGRRDHALAGLALGLAYLTRPEGVLYAALAGALLLAAARRRDGRRRRLTGLAVYVAAFAVLAVPYLLYLHHHTGRWLLTGKTSITLALWQGSAGQQPAVYDRAVAALDASGEELLWYSKERFAEPGLADLLTREPRQLLLRVTTNARALGRGLLRRWPFLPLVVLLAAWGAVWAARGRDQRQGTLFLGLMALPPLAFLALLVQTRFFAPAAPLVLALAAAGLDRLGALLAERLDRPRLRLALPAIAALGLLALWPPTFARGQVRLDFGPKATGLWLRLHSAPGTVVLARDLAIPVYAGRGFAPCPHAELAEILTYARRRGATLWATDARELTVIKPHLAFLLDPRRRPAGLAEIHRAESRGGVNLVFRLPG